MTGQNGPTQKRLRLQSPPLSSQNITTPGITNWQTASSYLYSIQPAVAESVKETKVQNKTENPQVTFLELGSVRCIPCKMMQPIMEEIQKEYAGKVKVVFHDVWKDEGKPYAKQYGIAGIPTQIFLDKDGKEFFRHTGFLAKDQDTLKAIKRERLEC